MGLDSLLAAGDLAGHAGVLAALGVVDEAAAKAISNLNRADLDDLLRLRDAVVAVGGRVVPDEATPEDIELLTAAGVVAKAVRKELDGRLATSESRRVAADKLAAAIAAEGNGALAAAGQLASAPARPRLPSISRLASRQPSHTRPARPGASVHPKTLTAAGQPVDGPDEAAVAAAAAIQRTVAQRQGWAGRELVPLVRAEAPYPAERQLGSDEHENQRRIEAVTGPQALVASGGVCGPVAVDYTVTAVAVNDRPVKQALAQFGASRGGVRYVLPHTLSQVTADGPAAIWTEATDANPGAATKPHATFLCQAVQEASVDAVTSIVQFGNFQTRYFPEQVAEYMTTVEAVHARLAESTLLAAIHAGSTPATAGSYELGAARDFLAEIDRAASAYRYRNRMGSDAPLRLIFPAYVLDMIRADLARNLPGDSGGQSERLAVSDAEILGWLRTRNVNSTPTLDSYSGAGTLQGFGAQGAGQLNPWPSKSVCWLFHEGAWMFLDGGELNLGMVRDSVLNRTNDFQMFAETFEKAVFRGHESLELSMSIAPTGASVGTVAPTTETIGS